MQDEHDFFFLYFSDHFFGIFDGFRVLPKYITNTNVLLFLDEYQRNVKSD